MSAPMPDSKSAAEVIQDRAGIEWADARLYLEAALERAVELVMSGEPSNPGSPRVDMDAFLDECVPEREQTKWFAQLVCAPSTDELVMTQGEIKREIEKRLRDYLSGSAIVEAIAARMIEEE